MTGSPRSSRAESTEWPGCSHEPGPSTALCKQEHSLLFSSQRKEGRKEMLYLKMHSTHFIYGFMASDIWYNGPLSERKVLVLLNSICFNLVCFDQV